MAASSAAVLAAGSCHQNATKEFITGSQQICSSLTAICQTNRLRVGSHDFSRLRVRSRTAPPGVTVEATFKDVLKSVVRFAANTPAKFFLQQLDRELDRAEESIKDSAAVIKGMANTVEKLAEYADKAADGVEELIEKVEATAEEIHDEIEEILDTVEEEKKTVKVLAEKLEKGELDATA
ncbi:hypothetical protein SELMODRAFT_446670 [Selaginella moellendorffii]|uniref:Uncharacterized protein n=1 Tax=Selaginella moellendorffii TaxID=88036 RepID=D8STE8_SELML|nr:uncharacterized protein LOC9659008 [Selaginella moellendorffii]EFJ12478.1 hypothetical protein SELMODRAFT_446670 [Selaginella moellendorffii]|eukprot:XP_002986621.1 uncharacterized protein LOC9659008 [Selaginella moellendorffii]